MMKCNRISLILSAGLVIGFSQTASSGLFSSNELNGAGVAGSQVSRSFSGSLGDETVYQGGLTYINLAPPRGLENSEEGSRYSSLRFSYTQPYGDQRLYFSNTIGDEERQHHVGATFDDTTVSFHLGESDSFSRTENTHQGFNPYFFHGGAAMDYRFSGASIQHDLNDRTSVLGGAVKINAADVEDRYGYFAGISSDHFYSRFAQYERGHEKVGHSIDAGLAFGRYQIEAQQINSKRNASLRRVAFQILGNNNDAFRLDIETGRNPLYHEADENRVLFSYSRLLGKTRMPMYANEEAEKPKGGFKTGTLIAAGVVGIAVVASSGSGDKDNAERDPAQHAAGRRALNRINPQSVRENREYGGWVYRNPDNSYASTTPRKGGVASVNIPVSDIPTGTEATASYHTHAGPDPRYLNEQFSPQDLAADRSFGVDGYLGTPAGRFLWHNHDTGAIQQLGNIAH